MKGHELLRERMAARGLSQVELARAIKADEPRVSRYLRGKLKPSFRVAMRIRDLLGIDPAVWV